MNEPVPARAPGPHPTPEQLYAARRGPRGEEAERHLAHAAACALCSEELLRQEAFDAPEPMAARDLEAAWARFGAPSASSRFPSPSSSRSSPSSSRSSRSPSRSSRSQVLALAAVLALAVVGFGLWRAAHPPTFGDLARGGEPVAGTWSPEGVVAAPPTEFVFPDPGGEPRQITVFDAAQSYVWTSPPATAGRVPFPEAERKRLQPGVEYLWTVLGDSGSAPARSFRIRARGSEG